jgi:hypothetical protein
MSHEIFLNLETARVCLNEARQLAEPENAISWNVANADMPKEWQEMVGADRVERDVPDLHSARRFVRTEHSRRLQNRRRVDLVSAQQLFVATDDSIFRLGGIEPAQGSRVVGDAFG